MAGMLELSEELKQLINMPRHVIQNTGRQSDKREGRRKGGRDGQWERGRNKIFVYF